VGQVTEILARLNAGDDSAAGELFPLVYEELRALADSFFRQFRPGDTMQPTALAHDAYLRLVAATDQQWENRAHFHAVAARAMRQLLLDYARSRRAQKRGGEAWRRVTLDDALASVESQTVDVLVLDETLGRLAVLNERQAQIVEMRVFGGLTIDETAVALGVGPTTVKSDWLIARAWLRREVARDRGT
jgi:RNA polymerase sigma factor (TIGR02999 family)